MELTETVLCQSVNNVKKTPSVPTVLTPALLATQDIRLALRKRIVVSKNRKNRYHNEKLSLKISLNQRRFHVSKAQSNLEKLQIPAKVAPTKTVLCQSVNSVQKTPSVKRVLDCASLAHKDLLPMETEQNAVIFEYIVSISLQVMSAPLCLFQSLFQSFEISPSLKTILLYYYTSMTAY